MAEYMKVLQHDDLILERNGDFYIKYIPNSEGNVYTSTNEQKKWSDYEISSLPKRALQTIFLPPGFPDTVSVDYLPNRIWCLCQELCSSVNRTLAMYSVFKAVGVGEVNASAFTATATMLGRDLTTMLGRIGFTWWTGFSLDADCKKWRLTADIIYNSTLFLELLLTIPLFRQFSWQTLCLAATLRSVVDIAGFASRNAVLQHQAIRSNIGDLSARDRSQDSLMCFIGTIMGILILNNITDSLLSIWILFLLSTVAHIYLNYKALRCLNIPVLNASRLILLVKYFLKHNKVKSVKTINEKESVVLGIGDTDERILGRKIFLGCSLQYLFGEKLTPFPIDLWKNLKTTYSDFPYVISYNSKSINVAFLDRISDNEMIQAYFHAFVLGLVIGKSFKMLKENHELPILIEKYNGTKSIETIVNNYVTPTWKKFDTGLTGTGWNLSCHQLTVGTFRLVKNENAK